MANEREPLPVFRPLALEMRHLRLVVAIVDGGGVTRASERLNLTQSALSHQLRQIEESLGVQLFLRVKKRLVPTEAAPELVARGRQVLAEVEMLEDDLRRRAAGWRGSLRIATECYTIYDWLPPLLKRFSRHHRNIDIRIVADATADPIRALENGEIDLAIVTEAGSRSSKIVTRRLFTDELLLIVGRDHPLAAKSFVRPADLETERVLLYGTPEESLFFQKFLVANGKRPAEVMQMKLTEAILAMVRAGLGVTAAARWALGPELADGRVIGVQLGEGGYFRDWHAAFVATRDRQVPQYVEDFIALVAGTAAPVRLAERMLATGTHGGRSLR